MQRDAQNGARSEGSIASPRPRYGLSFLVFLFAIFLSETVALGEIVNRSPRVLILHPYDERLPATVIVGETAGNRLLEATAGKIDLFSEFLDLSRFPEKSHIDRMARYLAEKYADHRPDVIIAVGEAATSFIVNHRDRIGRVMEASGFRVASYGSGDENSDTSAKLQTRMHSVHAQAKGWRFPLG